MRIVICIIYVHDDVDVSAYEYVNVYADGYKNDNNSYYWICIWIFIYARATKRKLICEIVSICGK